MAALLALALAAVVAGCGNKADTSGGGGGGDAAANWPDRDLRLMAPADPGGGWDGTARAMSQAMTDAKDIDNAGSRAGGRRRSSARARSKASPGPRRPTTRRSRACSSRC